jgi:hypothetical protein
VLRHHPVEKILFILALLLFTGGGFLRAWQVDFSDFDYGVYSDHFINAVTAKNIARGLGWSSSGYETYLLNPENLTTGPVVVLPVAAAIALWGNALSVPGLTLFALNLVLLALLLRSLRQIFARDPQFYLCGFLLLVFFTFIKSYYWYRMIGEVPALLLLLIAVAFLQRYFLHRNERHLYLAAVAVSFALGAKELVLLPALMLFSVVAILSLRREKSIATFAIKLLCFMLAGLSIPAAFLVYRHLLLGQQPVAWRSAYLVYAQGLHAYYSGVDTLWAYLASPGNTLVIFRRVFKGALWNGGTLLHLSYAGLRGVQYWLEAYIVVLIAICARRKMAVPHTLLAVAALPLLIWYFAISENAMPRHLFVGISLAMMAVLFFIVSVDNNGLRRVAALLFVALVIYTGDLSSRLTLASWPTQNPPNVVAMEDIQQHIENLPPKSLSWIGMVDNNEFEFLSPRPNNFRSGFDQIAQAVTLDEKAYISTHLQLQPLLDNHTYRSALDYYVSPQNRRTESVKVNFVRPIAFDWLHIKSEAARTYREGSTLNQGELCLRIVYQNAYYVIEHCSTDDISAFFASTGGMPLRPRKWTPWILLPFERAEVLY